MGDSWNRDRMLELGRHHAEVETRGDIDATMATLIDEPVYEFYPAGLRLTGSAGVRRYYEHLCREFIGHVEATLIDEWLSEGALAQEYDVALDRDGVREVHRVIGVLVHAEGTDKMLGERIYASDRCLRLMVGDALFDELEPIEG